MQDVIDRLADTIRATHPESPLCIRGGASKDFYGNYIPGRDNNLLDTRAYHGIVSYDPTELVVTARAGTRLIDLESELLANRQMLAFDPSGLLNPGKAIPTLRRCAEHGAMHVHRGEEKFPDLPRF